MNGLFELLDDINGKKRQEQALALRIGDKVWIVSEDTEKPNGYIIEENKVNEVCSKGFFISLFCPPSDDLGEYVLYEQIGKTVFFDKQGAEKCVEQKRVEAHIHCEDKRHFAKHTVLHIVIHILFHLVLHGVLEKFIH